MPNIPRIAIIATSGFHNNSGTIMFLRKLFSIGLLTTTLLTAACETPPVDRYSLENMSDYWQRSSASSAIYLQGPKAQQMLNRDIANCVIEIRELERLGALRHTIPADTPANNDTPEGNLSDWDTPEHNGALRSEHLPYHDFESCMAYKGWERIKYVPYDVQKRARDTYRETVLGEKQRTTFDQRGIDKKDDDGEFSTLNE